MRFALPTLTFLAALSLSCPAPWGTRTESLELAPGRSWSREIGHGKTLQIRFRAAAGQYLHLTVEQRGVDVGLRLEDPAGRLLYEADARIGNRRPENLWLVTPAAAEYRLEIKSLKPEEEGRVVLAVRELRPARKEDRLRAAAEGALARAEIRHGDPEAAAVAYRESLPPLVALKDLPKLADTEWRLGQSLTESGKLSEAVAPLERAAARFRGLGDTLGEARVLNDLGRARRSLGELQPALDSHQRALRLYQEIRHDLGIARSFNDMGLVLQQLGQFDAAIRCFEQSRVLWDRLGKDGPKAATLQNLSALYSLLGHDDEAMDLLRKALELRAGDQDPHSRMSLLNALGWAEYLAGHPERALERYAEALPLAVQSGDRLGEAGVWDRRGSALRALRRYREAAAAYARALAITEALHNRVSAAQTLANLGWLDLETGHIERAHDRLSAALDGLARSADTNSEVYVRVGLSRAERSRGSLGSARQQAESAVRLVEGLRASLRGQISRGQFFATRFDAYEELASLLMELDRREPGRGHGREALEVAERARARNLLEGLAGASEATRTEEQRREALRGEIGAIEARRRSLAERDPRDPRVQSLGADLRTRWLELDRLEAPDGPASPLPSLSAAEIQSLADEGTLIVVYMLSEPASFAWTIDRGEVKAHILPAGRERIEKLARRVAAGLSMGPELAAQRNVESTLAELSRIVLSPLGPRLVGHPTLAVLADGALHLVPFAALPEPGGGLREPLVVRHEVAMLPSATFLREQRRRLAGRPSAPNRIAVLADPIFEQDDDRLAGVPAFPGDLRREGRREPEAPYPGPLTRLPYTADEARAIAALVPREEILLALGPAASQDLVIEGGLRGYRILHFATHGILDSVLPERSGIVLSQYDKRGRLQAGFLSAPTVATLDLPAELVVLSGCQTGLGREVRGEGLVGLPQAFFRAGARRVVVSLWKVHDRGTAELMSRFYRHLLVEGLSPSASLRAAQVSLFRDEEWRSPYFWAGFTLQGDWK